MMEDSYHLQSRRGVFRGRRLYPREDQVILPDGGAATFGVIKIRAGLLVPAVNDLREVSPVQEYKCGVQRSSTEVVSGAIEDGEIPFQAAQRGLRDEAGLSAREWIDLGAIDPFTTVVRSPNRPRLPEIQFSDLPRGFWHHLLQRVDERRIPRGELHALQTWARTGPAAPDGDWYKDFGSFIVCGYGNFPKTLPEKGMRPFGDLIA